MKRFLLGCVNAWVGAFVGAFTCAGDYVNAAVNAFYFPGQSQWATLFMKYSWMFFLVYILFGALLFHCVGLWLRSRFQPKRAETQYEPPPIAKP